MAKEKATRADSARRNRAIRADARVGSARSIIEEAFALPEGSVCLLLPSGRKARSDKLISSLLRDWGHE